MKRLTCSTAIILLLGSFIWEGRAGGALAVSADPHAYFKNLVARSDHWKSFSLRTAGQLLSFAQGGYAFCNSCPQDITYSPSTDTDPHAQDAAKVVIQAFQPVADGILTKAIDASENYLHLQALKGTYVDREVKIDNEILTIPYYIPGTNQFAFDRVNNTVYVIRGQHGTTPKPHASGAIVMLSTNTIRNQVHLPLYTSDGHTYLFTWDTYYTDSWLNNGLTNLKTFQLSAPGPGKNTNSQLFELSNRFNDGPGYCTSSPLFDKKTDVSMVGFRATEPLGGVADWSLTDGGHIGPGVTSRDPTCPVSATFITKPNRWTRYWVRVDQRANDYDYFDMWVADEETNATKVYSHVPMSLRSTSSQPNSIHKFWLEFNTSTSHYVRGSERNFVTYVRNFVALRDVADTESLLQRPIGVPFVPPPSAPKNLRIVP